MAEDCLYDAGVLVCYSAQELERVRQDISLRIVPTHMKLELTVNPDCGTLFNVRVRGNDMVEVSQPNA